MKKSRTRKQRALRRLAQVILLLAALNMTGAVNFLPRQAMRDVAEECSLTEPRVIKSYYSDAIPQFRLARQYFVEGREGLMLCTAMWDPLQPTGWWGLRAALAPLCEGEPLSLGYRCAAQGKDYTAQVFGRVDDGRIARIVLRWRPGTGIEDDFRYWDVPEEAFFRVDGRRYVLCEAQEVGVNDELRWSEDQDKWFNFFVSDLTALAYDEAGTLLAESGIREYTSWMSAK